MSHNEVKEPQASSFRRYSFFGYVDVSAVSVGVAETSASNKNRSIISSVSIVDNFSLEQVQLEIVEMAAVDYVGFTDQCIFFLVSQTGRIFAYKNKILFCVKRESGDQTWKFVELDVRLHNSKLQDADESSSLLLRQWSHWDSWMSEFMIPPSTSALSASYFLVCTLFGSFLIVNEEDAKSRSTIERIYDSRPSKCTPQRYVLDFRVGQACAGNDHIVLLDDSGAVHSSGTGSHGELGHGILNSELKPKKVEMFSEAEISVVQISAGGWHSCALTSDGDLYGWGWNNHGQLGYPAEEFSIQTAPHPFDVDQTIRRIGCRNNATFLTLEDGSQMNLENVRK
uniref:Uncharacterized protein n=1 Tax=Ditylenchus dipsaci TaxID=166011 RepID=A0A915D8W0_9BILA